MKILKIVLLTFVGVSIFSCSKNSDKEEQPAPDEYKNHQKNIFYTATLNKYQTDNKAPGAIMLVSKPDQPLWIGAVGVADKENNVKMTTATTFRVGSITKIYVAAYILHMIENNKLSLNDKLSDLLPDIVANIPGSGNVTVKQLLAHMSGIPDPSNENEYYRYDLISNTESFGNYNLEDLLEQYVYGSSLHFAPGTQYRYSNTNYWLLQLIAENTMGESLPALLKTTFFDPLQLKNTYLEKKVNDNAAQGYRFFNNQATVTNVTIYDKTDSDGKASGGIVSNAHEISVFLTALFKGQLISPLLLGHMKQKQLAGCNSSECMYGLGMEIWYENDIIGYGHNGSSIGYEANALYFESSQTVIVLFKNLGGGSHKSFIYGIVNESEVEYED